MTDECYDWVTDFESVTDMIPGITNYGEARAKLCLMKLGKAASAHLRSLKPADKHNWPRLKKALRKRFTSSDESVLFKLTGAWQDRKTTIEEYDINSLTIADTALEANLIGNGNLNLLKKVVFVKELTDPDIKLKLLKRKPQTYKETVDYAIEMQHIQERMSESDVAR